MTNWNDVPKADFHVHFEGTASPPSNKQQITLPSGKILSPNSSDPYGKFAHAFLSSTANLCFKTTAKNYIEYAKRNSLVYTQFYISPSTHLAVGRTLHELANRVYEAQNIFQQYSFSHHWIADIVRGAPNSANITLDAIALFQEKGILVKAIGLAGDERRGSIKDYQEALNSFVDLETVIHVGEVLEDSEISLVVEEIKPARIAHALTLTPKLIELVNENNCFVELCPQSNLSLINEVSDCSRHKEIIRACNNVLICSDDPGLLGASISDNYRLLEQEGVPTKKLLDIAECSVQKAT